MPNQLFCFSMGNIPTNVVIIFLFILIFECRKNDLSCIDDGCGCVDSPRTGTGT